MNTHITITEAILILVICLPVYALGKTIIETIKPGNNEK